MCLITVAVWLVACAAGPKPLDITYPHADVEYGGFTNLPELMEQVFPFYVRIIAYSDIQPFGIVGAGSGIMLDHAGHIITAAHIVKDTRNSVEVTTANGNSLPARIVHVDVDNELALLHVAVKLDASIAPVYTHTVNIGQRVFAIGAHPARAAIVSVGAVRFARLTKTFRYGQYTFKDPITLVMPITTGYSGGPVFDEEGALVGMVVGFDWGRNDNNKITQLGDAYAIPASRLFDYYNTWSQR